MKTLLESLEQEWLCPISKLPMSDPVLTVDGYCYERQSIQKWFQSSQKSPITGLPLVSTTLVSNHVLKALKEKIKSRFTEEANGFNELKNENKYLTECIKELKQRLEHLHQKNQQEQQISKKQRKIKMETKRKEKELRSKKSQIQKLEAEIQKLKENLIEIEQQKELRMDHSREKIDQKVKKIQKKGIQQRTNPVNTQNLSKKLRDSYEKTIWQQTLVVDRYLFITCSFLSVLKELKTKNKFSSKLIQIVIQKTKENLYIFDKGNHLSKAPSVQCTRYFQIYSYLINEIGVITHERQDIGLMPQTCVEENQLYICGGKKEVYASVFNMVTMGLLRKLVLKFKGNKSLNKVQKSLAREVKGIIDIISRQDWDQVINSIKFFKHIQVLTFSNRSIQFLDIQEFDRFASLKYLEFNDFPLDKPSIEKIRQYQNQNPSIIAVFDQEEPLIQEVEQQVAHVIDSTSDKSLTQSYFIVEQKTKDTRKIELQSGEMEVSF